MSKKAEKVTEALEYASRLMRDFNPVGGRSPNEVRLISLAGEVVSLRRKSQEAETSREFNHSAAKAALDQRDGLLAEIANLVIALDESVKLQSHQAKMLNVYDGGGRRQFANGTEWVARLIECGRIPSSHEPRAAISNAHLMSAAPLLISSLKECLGYVESDYEGRNGFTGAVAGVVERARAAILEATGGQK